MRYALCLTFVFSIAALAHAAEQAGPATARGDAMLARYFERETRLLADHSLADIKTLDDWQRLRPQYRRELFEMLGLDPLPPRTPLAARTTGKLEQPDFTVEKIHFQSRPHLYVTGNLYLPKGRTAPAPAILYVCGHAKVKSGDVSYGNKTAYQHHGIWFARHGYVCLAIDTLQLGEIEGIHHGTYREGMWWWLARGYTPAGVEAWNCIRALDYLEMRPEVDRQQIGVTGRSGGGAYSWWISTIDERIKAAVPVAGITDLENHVVDGCVEGHCDCMYMVNTYRWDYPQVAAMVAPRPLLISNTDKDGIFPLEGIVRLHHKTREIYRLLGADKQLGLQISEGPHKDIQELQIAAFRWFDRFLRHEDRLIDQAAVKVFEPAELKVFDKLPADEVNTTIQETFTQAAPAPALPASPSDWQRMRDADMAALREKCFRGWPEDAGPLEVRKAFDVERRGIRLAAVDFTSQPEVGLRLYVAERAGLKKPELTVLHVHDDASWSEWLAQMRTAFGPELADEFAVEADAKAFGELEGMFRSFPWTMAWIAPRGVGPMAFSADKKKQVQNRRRFMLLGQTLDGMQVWDVRRGVQALRSLPGRDEVPLWLEGERQAAGLALYAALFEPDIARLDLWHMPRSHREGPYFLNVLRYLDVPFATALAAERSRLRIYDEAPDAWSYPREVGSRLGWKEKQIEIRKPPKPKG